MTRITAEGLETLNLSFGPNLYELSSTATTEPIISSKTGYYTYNLEIVTVQFKALAEADPSVLLDYCQRAKCFTQIIFNSGLYPVYNAYITSAEYSPAEQKEDLWVVTMTIKGLNTPWPNISNPDQLIYMEANVNYDLGSPATATVTFKNLNPGNYTTRKKYSLIYQPWYVYDPVLGAQLTARILNLLDYSAYGTAPESVTLKAWEQYGFVLLFTGYADSVEEWTEDGVDSDGNTITINWTRINLTDMCKSVGQRLITEPKYFPHDENGDPYHDGVDHYINLATVVSECFAACDLPTAWTSDLPTSYGFHSGTEGETTWIIEEFTPLNSITQIIYELTGGVFWADQYGDYHFGGGGGSISNLKYKSLGEADENYRAVVYGEGSEGLYTYAGTNGAYPAGYFIEPAIKGLTELQAACDYMLIQTWKNFYRTTYTGKLANILDNKGSIVTPGGNVLSIRIHLGMNFTNAFPLTTTNFAQEITDEVEIVLGSSFT